MRETVLLTVVAAAAIAVNAYVGEWSDVLVVAAIWCVAAAAMWSTRRTSRGARALLADETRLALRTRPIGVTVDFEGVLEPVPCEVVADPDGEHDENGNPLGWIARPHRVPEGAGGIRSYSVAVWPGGHSMRLDGLD